MRLILVTSNRNKAAEFRQLIPGIEIASAEYPELRSEDNCEISMLAARMLAQKMKRPVIVEDSGLFIDALGGFPGAYTKHVTSKIGNKGILQLMKGKKNRKCRYKSAIGYCEPGKEPLCFVGIEEGRISSKEKGKNGWGNDIIFMPKGKSKTYSELKKPGQPGKFRIESISKLKEFLSSRNN